MPISSKLLATQNEPFWPWMICCTLMFFILVTVGINAFSFMNFFIITITSLASVRVHSKLSMVGFINLRIVRMRLGISISLCQTMSKKLLRRLTLFGDTFSLLIIRKVMRTTGDGSCSLWLMTMISSGSFLARKDYNIDREKICVLVMLDPLRSQNV